MWTSWKKSITIEILDLIYRQSGKKAHLRAGVIRLEFPEVYHWVSGDRIAEAWVTKTTKKRIELFISLQNLSFIIAQTCYLIE